MLSQIIKTSERIKLKFRLLIVLNLIMSPPLLAEKKLFYQPPQQRDDGWKTNNLNSTAHDVFLIEKFFSQLHTSQHQIDSTLLVVDGQIVLEHYFAEQNTDQQHDLRSVTKSIWSLLMGIAIDQGFIKNFNDSIFKYLKSHQVKKNNHPSKQNITIKHLLTMSSGLDCDDWDDKSKGQEDRVYKKKDWIQYTIDLPLINEPGAASHYCSMGVVLAAEIISQASGMEIDVFAEKFLFKPLGISNLSWNHTSKRKHLLTSGKRLYMTTRDLAKVGQLILQNGQWQGQKIVSSDWIKQATGSQTKLASMDYGFLWWQIPFVVNKQKQMAITATGNGGQYLFIFPALNVVAVFTGSAYNSPQDKLPFAVVKDIYLPTLVNQ